MPLVRRQTRAPRHRGDVHCLPQPCAGERRRSSMKDEHLPGRHRPQLLESRTRLEVAQSLPPPRWQRAPLRRARQQPLDVGLWSPRAQAPPPPALPLRWASMSRRSSTDLTLPGVRDAQRSPLRLVPARRQRYQYLRQRAWRRPEAWCQRTCCCRSAIARRNPSPPPPPEARHQPRWTSTAAALAAGSYLAPLEPCWQGGPATPEPCG